MGANVGSEEVIRFLAAPVFDRSICELPIRLRKRF